MMTKNTDKKREQMMMFSMDEMCIRDSPYRSPAPHTAVLRLIVRKQ